VSLKALPEKISSVAQSEAGEDGTQQPVKAVRLFHDDTLKTYSRRLDFSPDGEVLFVPTGYLEINSSAINAFYAFSRINLST
jgi:chromatin assembly factor 1 subunit B